eukprot:286754_1
MAAESFKWAQKAIDDARNELLEANAELNKEQFKLETEYDPTYDNVCNQCKRAVALVKQLDQISALNDCVTEISKSLLAHLLAAVSSNDKNESEKETLMIRNIIQEVWNGSSLKEFTIACDKYTMLILSESCINNIKHPHSITATGRTIMREQKTHEENALERLDIGLMRTYSQLRPLSSHSSAPYRTRSSDNASTGDENYERWMMQVNLKVRLGLNITTPVQTNLMFRAMDDERHWLMPRPTISEDSATLSRKICFFHPEHKVNESGFEDTPDFIVYHSENKYLRIHLQTMRHCNVKIDLSMFEALDIEHCFIDVDKDQHISLTLITSNKEMYFHHMLCITGVKDLHFSDECIIKSAQIWLLRNQNVVIFPMCRLSAITTWFYQCKEVTNNGTLVNISNCWMDGGDSFENAEEGTVKSYGYLYLNMRQIENKNRIESDIFYHVVANRYEDTGDSSTHVADSMYFNIQERCHVEGIFSARSWLLNVGNQLKLSSNRIMIDRLFYEAILLNDGNVLIHNVDESAMLSITSKGEEEPDHLDEGDMDEPDDSKTDSIGLSSADKSKVAIAIQHYQITTKNEDCKLDIMNVANAKIDHCKIACYDLSFHNARDIWCGNESVVQCKHGKFIKENVMVGLMSRSHMHLNIVDSHHNNAYKIYGCHDHAMRFAQYMTEEATLCIKADSLSIEYGEIECEILSLHVRNLSISSKKLHITNKLRIEFKDKEEAILLNDGDILIRPFVDAKAQCMLSADQSTMMISIQHYEMMTRMKDCRLNIMNVTNAQINHCNIECYDMYFMNARDVRCSNASVIDCLHMFVCNEMDDFNLVNQSTIVAKEKEAIIDVINSFCVDKTSKICIDNEQCQINATMLCIEPRSASMIRTKQICNITADNATIHADIESPVLLLTINTLSISSNKIHITKTLTL